MWLKFINIFSIFQVYNLIGPSSSITSLTFGESILDTIEDYNRLKHSSVHRGVFLSLSDARKHEICQDFYGSESYVTSTEDTSTDEPKPRKYKYNLLVQELTVNGQPHFQEWGLVVMCPSTVPTERLPAQKHHYLATAFLPKWLYHTEVPDTDPTRNDQFLMNFVTLSPDYRPLQQTELKQRYLNTLQTIIALSTESPEYVDQIKEQDSLSKLSKKERLILCASILSSPVYRRDNWKYSVKWIRRTFKTPGGAELEEKFVTFRNAADNTEVKLRTECFLCKGFEKNKKNSDYFKSINLYVSRTYGDGYSAMVLKEQKDGTIFADNYFANIAPLIAAQKKISYDRLTPNFIKEKSFK